MICSAFFCSAQIKIEDSPFANVPISEILNAPPKKLSKKELKKLSKDSGDPIDAPSSLRFELKVDYARLSTGKIATFFTGEIANQELAFEPIDNIQSSRIEIFGRVISVDEKINGIFEERAAFCVKASEQKIPLQGKQTYLKGIILPVGAYKITLVMRDSLNGKIGLTWIRFTVPDFEN